MKALIIYDDFDCATNTNAILHRAALQADATVNWDIRPWRLNILRFSPTWEEALDDAANAHLIVLAFRHTSSLPAWLMDWLEQWAALSQTPDAALAVLSDRNAKTPLAPPPVELSQFARQYGLTVICGDDDMIAGNSGDSSFLRDPPHFRQAFQH